MKMMMFTAISFLCVGALSASADPAPNPGPIQMKKEGTGCTVALPILVPFASVCAQTSAYNALAKSCQKKLDGHGLINRASVTYETDCAHYEGLDNWSPFIRQCVTVAKGDCSSDSSVSSVSPPANSNSNQNLGQTPSVAQNPNVSNSASDARQAEQTARNSAASADTVASAPEQREAADAGH
jgi:hypothetical protein